MERRKFLKAIAALPLVPAALRGWAEEKAEATEPEPQGRGLNDTVLAYAEGEVGAVSVVAPPGRTVRVHASAFITGIDGKPAELRIYEDGVLVARQIRDWPGMDYLDVNVVLAPTPGLHTYKMAARGNVEMGRTHRPTIFVETYHGAP